MDYFQYRAAYYSLTAAEFLGMRAESAYAALAPIFMLESADPYMLGLIAADTLDVLDTAEALTVYGNYVRSFGAGETGYGATADEAKMLEIKLGVVHTLEKLGNTPASDPLVALAENHEEIGMSVVYALVMYMRNPAAAKSYINILRRAATDADGIDACIALMFFERDKADSRIAAIKTCAAYELYPEIGKKLSEKFGIVNAPAPKTVWDD